MMAEAGAEHPSVSLHSLLCEVDCLGNAVTSYSEDSEAVVDVCVKSEPEDQHISHPKNYTAVQGFGAGEMGSGLDLDTDHIKSEIVTIKIMDRTDLQLQYSSVEGFCCPSEHLNSTCVLSKQYKSETDEVRIEQKCLLQVPSCAKKESNEAANYDIKGVNQDLEKHELNIFCLLPKQYKSEKGEVKVEPPSQLEGSSNTETAGNEAEEDVSQNNCLKLENNLNTITDMQSCMRRGTNFSKICQLKHQLFLCAKECKYNQSIKNFSHLENSEDSQHVHFDKKPYKCSECGKSFSRGDNLKQHRLIHSGEKPYKCNQCGKNFSRYHYLKLHHVVHSGEKPYKCSECGKSFSTGGNLKKHQVIHSGAKPYKCSECGKSFSHGSYLKKHVFLHSGEKPYKCEECGKSFSRGGNLKQHQLLHSGEKPYKCEECGRSFSRGGNLKQHQLLHSVEKPYRCGCGKGFSQCGKLKRHQLVHSVENTYKCSECGQIFSNGSALKKHQIIHSNDKPYKCIECGKTFSCGTKLKWHQLVHSAETI